jgi:hypothetical protein
MTKTVESTGEWLQVTVEWCKGGCMREGMGGWRR